MAGKRQAKNSAFETPFRGRKREVAALVSGMESPLCNVYGVSGIGKSRLLHEIAQQIRNGSTEAIVIEVDLETLPDRSSERPAALLKQIIDGEPERLQGVWRDVKQVAGEVVNKLDSLAADPSRNVYLLLDSTECVQQDTAFWRWMEANLIGPLVVEGNVRLVVAGRFPAPWRRFEIRSAAELLPLKPLPREGAARQLVRDVLNAYPSEREETVLDRATALVLQLSFGHPRLSEKLAAYLASRLPEAIDDENALLQELCQEVVTPFIRQDLFGNLEKPWPTILEWASVLDYFVDPQMLQSYLRKLELGVAKEPELFFIRGVATMRLEHALVRWEEGKGFAIHGVLRDILRQHMRVLHPNDYDRACNAMGAVYRAMAEDVGKETDAGKLYLEYAREYEARASTEAAA